MTASGIDYNLLVMATSDIRSVDLVDGVDEGTVGEVIGEGYFSDNESPVIQVRFFTPEGRRTWQVSTQSVGHLPLNNPKVLLIERDTTANQLSLEELTARAGAADNSY
jgi:hypothetical protein